MQNLVSGHKLYQSEAFSKYGMFANLNAKFFFFFLFTVLRIWVDPHNYGLCTPKTLFLLIKNSVVNLFLNWVLVLYFSNNFVFYVYIFVWFVVYMHWNVLEISFLSTLPLYNPQFNPLMHSGAICVICINNCSSCRMRYFSVLNYCSFQFIFNVII